MAAFRSGGGPFIVASSISYPFVGLYVLKNSAGGNPMTEYKSDVARIRAQIEDEYRVMQLMKSGLAITARHDFIEARMHRIDQHWQELAPIIGEEQATEIVIEINNRLIAPSPNPSAATTVLLQGETFIDGYHDGFLTFLDTYQGTTF